MSESNQVKFVGVRPTNPPSNPIPVTDTQLTAILTQLTVLNNLQKQRFPDGVWDSQSINLAFAAAGEQDMIVITPADGTTVYLSDLSFGGDVAGYAFVEWDNTQEWGRLYFPTNCSLVEQLYGRINNGFIGDGTKVLKIIMYLGAVGSASASVTYLTATT